MPELLVVAGHDPSYGEVGGVLEGAGVDADREAAEAFGVRALTVVTAWTEQAGGKVTSLGAVEPAIWLREALQLVEERRGTLGALKLGMLPNESAVRAASELVRRARRLVPRLWVVVDPVLAASGGEALSSDAARRALAEDLLAQGVVLTPNRPEARELLALSRPELAGRAPKLAPEELALALFGALSAGRGSETRRGLVLKGGHGGEDPVRDLVLGPGGASAVHEHPRRVRRSLHGSGCRHASAVAAGLCKGQDLPSAAAAAGAWLGERFADLP